MRLVGVAAALALAVLSLAGFKGVDGGKLAFNWTTVPYFVHCANNTGAVSESMYAPFASPFM